MRTRLRKAFSPILSASILKRWPVLYVPRGQVHVIVYTTVMDAPSTPSEVPAPSRRPVYQVETTGTYSGDVKEAFKVREC